MNREALLITALSGLALVLSAPPCAAQTTPAEDPRGAQLRAVRAAHLANDHARALELATRALAERETGTLHGIIAREHLDLGHVVEALAHAETCARAAPAEPATNDRDVILEWCRYQSVTLARRVATVALEVPSQPAGVQVTVAGRALDVTRSGGVRVAPGHVVVEATTEGSPPFRYEVDVAPGDTAPVTVRFARPSPPPPLPSPSPARSQAVWSAPSTARRNPLGLVLGGVGAAAILSGVITWLAADQICRERSVSSNGCDLASADDTRTVHALDVASNIGLWGGAGLLATGVVLYLVLPRQSPHTEPRVTVSLGVGSLGLAGTF